MNRCMWRGIRLSTKVQGHSTNMRTLASIAAMLSGVVLLLGAACGECGARREQAEARESKGQPPVVSLPAVGDDPEALYLRAAKCMDELAADSCATEALESFFALEVAARSERVGANLRLIELHRRAEDTKRAQSPGTGDLDALGNVPLGSDSFARAVRVLPSDFGLLHGVDVERLRQAPLFGKLSPDVRDTLLTCDAKRREQLKKASEARRAGREKRGDEGDEDGEREDGPPPVYEEGACELLRRLETPDRGMLRAWVGGRAHADALRSAVVLEFGDPAELDRKLGVAKEQGRLTPRGEHRWEMTRFDYEGASPHVATWSPSQLVLAPEAVMDGLLAAARGRDTNQTEARDARILEIPPDAFFFSRFSSEALRAFKAKMGLLAQAMPDAESLVFSGVAYDHLGLFVRVSTADSTRASVLVELARAALGAGLLERDGAGPLSELTRRIAFGQSSDGVGHARIGDPRPRAARTYDAAVTGAAGSARGDQAFTATRGDSRVAGRSRSLHRWRLYSFSHSSSAWPVAHWARTQGHRL